MYEQHFGLKRPPFRTVMTGAEVFLGPQTAQTIKAVRKALATQDAAITVSGPVGVGKTTVVGRALDALGGKQTRIRIGRMSIAHDEILDYLLDVLGIKEIPASTIRRIALFRAVLAQKIQAGERVIVIVEDGARLGEDPLAELEALTAADGGAGGGAAIVIMGDPGLRTALDKPSLDRLNQRTRLRHQLKPLNEGEMTGYLKHCFRLSGNEFETIFDAEAPAVLTQLSGGIPRVCNNLVDSTLAAAADQSLDRIDIDFLNRVAADEYGLSVNSTPADVSQVAEALKPKSADSAGDQRSKIQISQTQSMPALSEDALSASEQQAVNAEAEKPQTRSTSVADAAPPGVEESDAATAAGGQNSRKTAPTGHEPASDPEFEIPELIQDTMPELAALPSKLADAASSGADIPTLEVPETLKSGLDKPAGTGKAATGSAGQPAASNASVPAAKKPAAKPTAKQAAAQEPAADKPPPQSKPVADKAPPKPASLSPEPAATAPDKDEPPAWDRDPTLAELRPDLEALESAMAEVTCEAEEKKPPPADAPEIEIALKDPTLPGVPELKLEESIQQSIDEATAALEKHDSTIAEGQAAEELAKAAPSDAKADAELEKIAEGLARAKTLDDVDDQMAETLFGEEFSLMAAQVAANCADIDTGDDDAADAAPAEPEAPPQTPPEDTAKPEAPPAPAAETITLEAEAEPASPASTTTGAPDSSPSARLKTVQALNTEAGQRPPSVAGMAGNKPATSPPAGNGTTPPTIDNQFAGGITSTRIPKPAELATVSDDDEDDDEDSKMSGFFSRFKRS